MFRSMSANEMGSYGTAIANCVTVDPGGRGAYQRLAHQLGALEDIRIRRFVLRTGQRNAFMAWDSDPAHR